MVNHGRRVRIFAISMAVLAGYVDAIGFVTLGGYFVSFMSGNSTRLGVAFAQSPLLAVLPAGLIGLFVVGVILGALTGHAARRRRKPAVLALVTLLLLAALAAEYTLGPVFAAAAMAIAMGAENAIFDQQEGLTIGLTYMTGTLVKLGQHIAGALFFHGDRLNWIWYFMHWLGLASGAAIGALLYGRLGVDALWVAVACGAMLTAVSFAIP